jgi:hypothetical protein
MSLVLHAAIGTAEAVALYFFFSRLLGDRVKSKWAYMAVYSAYFCFAIFPPLLFGGIDITSAVSFVFPPLIALILYRGSAAMKLIIAGLSIAYHFISEPISAAIIMWISGHAFPKLQEYDAFYIVGAVLSAAIYVSIILALSFRHRPRIQLLQPKYHILLLLMVGACCYLAYAEAVSIFGSAETVSAMSLLSELTIGGMSVFIYYVFDKFQEDAGRELVNRMLAKQMSEIRDRFEIIESRDREMLALKHNMKNQLAVIGRLSAEQKTGALNEWVASLTNHIQGVIGEPLIGVAAADAIIAIKRERAARLGTEFRIKSAGVSKIMIDPIHLNIVIGNALDNALEACGKLPEGAARYVELAVKTDGDFLYIRVTNSSPSMKALSGELPRSTKRNAERHGIGLESIRRMVDAYSGIFKIETSESEFVLMLRMRNAVPPGTAQTPFPGA